MQALGVTPEPASTPPNVQPRWGNAPISSFALMILIVLGLVTGTMAEIRMRISASGRLGRRVPRDAFSVDGDVTEPKARRRGDDHDRPLTHQHEYDPATDPDHERDHDPNYWNTHRNATIYPGAKLSPFMRDLINSAAVGAVLLIPAIRKLGFDPNERLTVHLSEFGNTNIAQTRRSTISPIEVIMHYTTTEKIADSFQPTGERAIQFKNLVTDSKKYGIDNFFTTHVVKPLIFEFTREGTQKILDKLTTFGIGPNDNASLFEVSGRGRKKATLAQHEDAFVRHADLGAILKVEKHGRARYFAVVPHHPELVIEVPSITGDVWKGWMAEKGKSLLFKDPSELPSGLRYAANQKEATALDSLDWVKNVVENILKPIVENSVTVLSSLVCNEYPVVTAAHTAAGLFVPFYDFGRAFFNGDMPAAAIFLGLEFIPLAGSLGKQVFKTVYNGARLPHTIRRMLKKFELTTGLIFDKGKDMHGLGFLKIKPARSAFKKGGRYWVHRKDDNEEEEN
jgi:hypothetical protein